MSVMNGNSLDLVVTDKHSAEDWNCSYDATYIENLTHKTGNFKQFDVFITMLKSGLLKTSECVSLDLLTFDDLELLRSRRILSRTTCTPRPVNSNNLITNSNRRYFILTYTVEFDRIHYPLPMEYCGPPDPQVLQAVIRRLESEISRLQDQLHKPSHEINFNGNVEQVGILEKRVEKLTSENIRLSNEVKYLTKTLNKRASSSRQVDFLKKAMKTLEDSVLQERSSFHKLVCRLREEKLLLSNQVEDLRSIERGLRKRLNVLSKKCTVIKGYEESRKERARCNSNQRAEERIGSINTINNQQNKYRSQSPGLPPNWGSTLQTKANFQTMNKTGTDNCVANKKHIAFMQSQSTDLLHPVERVIFQSRTRSSSESSVESRKQTRSATSCTNQLAGRSLQPQSVKKGNPVDLPRTGSMGPIQRGRTKTRRQYRSSSGSSSRCCAIQERASCGDRSRHSSVSSVGSSKSQCSRNDSQESEQISRSKGPRARRKKRGNQALKMGVSDLETRIHKLQKLLREGVGPMKE